MKTKTTLILLGVVIALGIWIKYYESQRPNTNEARRQSGNVLNFERDNLSGIEIQNGEETIVLRRSEGRGRPAQLYRYAPRKRRSSRRGVRFELLGG